MPRYFFNIYDGKDIPDPTGTELCSLKEACEEAVRLVKLLLTEGGDDFWNGHDWSLNIADGSGNVLFTLQCNATIIQVENNA